MSKERRVDGSAEVRNLGEGSEDPPQITGYAARFDALSEDLGGFRERIAPGAFAGVLDDDVRALVNHDSNLVLGRSRANTLRMREDDMGLRVEIDLPRAHFASDLAESMRRGDVDQMSFGFIVDRDTWALGADDMPERTILAFRRLFDVSVVTFPAYPQTEASVRSAGLAQIERPGLRRAHNLRRIALAALSR